MTQIHLTTQDNNTIIIQLLDNPFITDFVAQLKFVKQHFEMRNWRETIPYTRSSYWDEKYAKKVEQDLIATVNKLNELGYKFPVPVEEIRIENTEAGRQLLNRLHRHFTTSHRSVSHNEPIQTWLDGSEYTFNLDQADYPVFSKLVHNINTVVNQM
jgi:hypothetical protein